MNIEKKINKTIIPQNKNNQEIMNRRYGRNKYQNF